ncbi:MAG: COX15/CtaA family protein [Trueperaceae bacterium]|nr:COX15/CtaA family protein [Trueperaceae bacterium]
MADTHPRGVAAAQEGSLSPRRRRHLRAWLWSGAALTFVTLVVGGITRLTQSGLSIVDWDPIMGVVPPLNEAAWRQAFDRYRAFPEYQQLRTGMSLAEFKFIYFWEYLHRLVARLIGVVFLLPFAWFWARGYLNRRWLRRAGLLFALGALQGVMGWFMVMSGLVDRPSVSHYRLAAHLALAFAIVGTCLWFAADLSPRAASRAPARARPRYLLAGVWALGGVLAAQVVWGAFTAGLDAGHVFNTFPRMGGRWLPPGLDALSPVARNLVENPVAVQWVHRVLATVLLVGAAALQVYAWRAGADARSRRFAAGMVALVLAQYLLGVATLLLVVPVSLAVAHQAAALVLFGTWISWLHHLTRGPAARPAAT